MLFKITVLPLSKATLYKLQKDILFAIKANCRSR